VLQQFGVSVPDAPDLVVRRQEELRAGVQAGMSLLSAQGWLGVSAGRRGVELAERSVEAARVQLLFGVAQAFWMAHVSRELVGIQESQLLAAARHLELAEARVAQGDALRIDVVRAETEVEKARQDLLAAHLNLDNTRDALSNLVGSDALLLPEAPPELAAPEDGDAGVGERADVKAAHAAARLAERMTDVAWAQFLPSLSVTGQLGYLFSEPPDLGSQDRSRWAAMLVLSVPLYSQVRFADLDAKRAARHQAELRVAETEASAALEVRKAQRDYRVALASLETAGHQAALAQEALQLTEAAYENGAATSLDVTDAQRTQTTAALNAAAQRLRSQISLLTLMRAAGDDPAMLATAARRD